MTPGLSRVLGTFEESATLALAARAKKMAREGKSIVNFAAGEPDFVTPNEIIDAAADAAKKGATKYTAVAGDPNALKAVAERVTQDYGVPFSPDEIVIANGGKQAIYHFFQAVLDKDDEVLIVSPFWTSFPEMVKLVGGKPVIVRPSGGRLQAKDLEKALTKKTKAFVLNSPANPDGIVFTREEIKSFIDVLKPHPIWFLSDDTYYQLVYAPSKFTSLLQVDPSLKDRTCVVWSASKTYAMTGWRLGWAAAPKTLRDAMVKLQGQVTSGASSLSQAGIVEAVTKSHAYAQKFHGIFETRRRLLMELLTKEGLKFKAPEGAFYCFVELQSKIKGSVTEFCTRLLDQHGLCLVPGEAFGESEYARISYALSEKEIEEGIKRLCSSLKGP